ncbi:MAG: M15 family metallopeptidase [Agathobacter sp.]
MKKFLGIIITGLVLLNMTACQMQQPAQPTESGEKSSIADTGTEGTETEGTEMESATEPEEDSSEPAELPILEDDQIVRVMDYIPTIQQELRYATIDNFTGRIIYDFDDAYLRYGTIKKLAKACEKLAEYGLGIKIWDAFRPLEAQEALWEICPDPNYVSHPKTGTRSHCKGSAVDITLVDLKTGQEVAVPSGFDEFSALGDRDYSDCGEEAAKNAKLLEDVMKECGFKPYSKEWWHFSDTDSYEVEENFYPVIPELWYANCEEYINLRKDPDIGADVIKNIPAGEVVEFQDWYGRFAKVSYGNKEGYVMSSYIAPVDEDYLEDRIDTIAIAEIYSYEQMLTDIQRLCKKYPELLETEVIGKSEMGRDIPVIRIGNMDAEYHVLFQGAIHGREHRRLCKRMEGKCIGGRY